MIIKKMIDFWYGTMESRYMSRMGHFTTGFMISAIIGNFWGAHAGLAIGAIAAVGKELVDKMSGRGKPELIAAGITNAGSLLAYFILR